MTNQLIQQEAITSIERLINRVSKLESNDYFRPIQATGVTSNPPTQGEITGLFGTPSSFNSEMIGLIKDTINGRSWIVFSDKISWYVVGLNGTTTINGSMFTPASTITLANGDNHNVVLPNATYIRYTSPTGSHAITGFTNGADGRHIYLANYSGQSLTVRTLSGGSSASNQINTSSGDLSVGVNTRLHFIYDSTLSKWMLFSMRGLTGSI